MLSYNALIEEAKLRGLPPDKMRGALREYLQILILKAISNSEEAKNLFFTGGTYLRLLHNLKRFSEDLDFNIDKFNLTSFRRLLKYISENLHLIGFSPEIDIAYKKDSMTGYLTFPEVEKKYAVVSKYSRKEGITIKIELQKRKWKIEKETLLVSGFGEMFPLICTKISTLFADKIDALIKKERPRDLYDIIFLLSRQEKPDIKVLKHFGIEDDPLEIIFEKVESIPVEELKRKAKQIQPFLFDENEVNLIIHIHSIIPQLIKRYTENNIV